jgi:hypothetical protein
MPAISLFIELNLMPFLSSITAIMSAWSSPCLHTRMFVCAKHECTLIRFSDCPFGSLSLVDKVEGPSSILARLHSVDLCAERRVLSFVKGHGSLLSLSSL